MESTNNYMETDLGNVSPNPKGTYDNATAYEYLDLIEYQGGSYLCTVDIDKKVKGISPVAGQNSETWQLVALPGTSTEEYVAKHTEVIEKAKQVETSRAAVELCKQEVESAQADVEQMRQDTQQAAQNASDANTEAQQAAQQAEASRSAAQTSEQNAAASRDLANTYKANAETAKSAAETAAQNASESKTATETAAQEATESKTVAETAAQEATESKTVAETAAQNATESKTVAETAAQEATESKTVAETAAQEATESKTAAETAAQNASESKTAAETAAQNAAQSKADIINIKAGIEEAAKGENVSQIQKNMNDIGSLKEDLSNKITKFYASNQGETHITDSDNGKIQDMMIYGKSSQDGTPTTENPVEIKSVVNPVVKVCGKNLLQPNLRYNDRVKINIKKGAKLTLICKNGMASKGGNLKFEKANGELKWLGIDKGSAKRQIMLDSDVVAYTYLFNLETSENYALYIGDENTYEPYKEQSMQLHITLNAIPVSSGGNVTINGQQYVADYVDVERGKIVKCIEKYRISSGLKWIYEPSENDRFGAYGLNININPNFVENTLFTHYQNKPSGTGGYIAPGNIRLHNFQGFTDVTNFKEWLDKNESYAYFAKNTLEEIDLTIEEIQIFKALSTYYPATNISVNSEQLDGYTVFNYPISMANGWNYVKQQLNDNRDYIYDMDIQSAEAYVNSEYAVALTELEVM